jgi:hypothetical protein
LTSVKQIDALANEKGSFVKTLWQFVKFIFVSLIAFFTEFFLLNTLKYIPFIHNLYGTEFKWWIFKSSIEAGGLGYFIVSCLSNFLSRIVAFFVNRTKTFNSDANIAITLPIYLTFAVSLLVFLSWLNPILKAKFVLAGLGDTAAANASTMCCCCIQFFSYFPVDKTLFHKEKQTA